MDVVLLVVRNIDEDHLLKQKRERHFIGNVQLRKQNI